MSALVASELLKLRTTRTAWGFLIAVVVLTLGLLALQLGFGSFEAAETPVFEGEVTREEQLRAALAGSGILSTLLLVLGIVGTTGENRHGTITPTYLATPRRERVILAKLGAYFAAGAALGAVAMAVTFAIALPWLGARDVPVDLPAGAYAELVAGGVLVAGLGGAIGVGVGALLRNQVVAVVVALVALLVVEPVVVGFVPDVGRFTVGAASGALGGGAGETEGVLGWWQGGLGLVAWAAVLAGAAMLLERRRDVT